MRAQIRIGRDDVAGALADAERALELVRITKDPQSLNETTARCANIFGECGDLQRAATLADELLAELRAERGFGSAKTILHIFASTMSALGRERELIEVLARADVPWVSAAKSFASGDV